VKWFADLDRTARLGLALSAASLVALAVGLFFVISALTDDPVQLPSEGSIEDIVDDASGEAVGAVPPPNASPVPSGPRPTRIAVPRLFIDAPVGAFGFEDEAGRVPAVPDRGDLVAWYEFTPPPGLGANAVFSGHVDWQTPGGSPIPGVFYRLRELRIGDPVIVTLEDGKVIEYRVTGNVAAKYDDPNVGRSFAGTSKDVITIITCGGSWTDDSRSPEGGSYSHRIIVRAENIAPPAAASAAGR
jgi:hypothetical protein